MYSALLLHSPCFAHCEHETSRSLQTCVQTPHVRGQSDLTCSAFSPVHSPSAPHAEHERSRSLQIPTADAPATRAARMARRIGVYGEYAFLLKCLNLTDSAPPPTPAKRAGSRPRLQRAVEHDPHAVIHAGRTLVPAKVEFAPRPADIVRVRHRAKFEEDPSKG